MVTSSPTSQGFRFSFGTALDGTSNLAQEMLSLLDSTFLSSPPSSTTLEPVKALSTRPSSPPDQSIGLNSSIPKRSSSRKRSMHSSVGSQKRLDLSFCAKSDASRSSMLSRTSRTGSSISPGPPPAFALPPTPDALKTDKLYLSLFDSDLDMLVSTVAKDNVSKSSMSGGMTPPATPGKPDFEEPIVRDTSTELFGSSMFSHQMSLDFVTSSSANDSSIDSTRSSRKILARSSSLSVRTRSKSSVSSTKSPRTISPGNYLQSPLSLEESNKNARIEPFSPTSLGSLDMAEATREEQPQLIYDNAPLTLSTIRETSFSFDSFQKSWVTIQLPVKVHRQRHISKHPPMITFHIPPPPRHPPPINKKANGNINTNVHVDNVFSSFQLPSLFDFDTMSYLTDNEQKSKDKSLPRPPPTPMKDVFVNDSPPPLPCKKDLSAPILPDPPMEQPTPLVVKNDWSSRISLTSKPQSEERIKQMGIFDLEPKPKSRRHGRKGSLGAPKSPFLSTKAPSIRSVRTESPGRKSLDAMSVRTMDTSDGRLEDGLDAGILTVDTGVPLIPVTSFVTPMHERPPPLPPKDGATLHISDPILLSTSSNVPIVPIPEVLNDLRKIGRLPPKHDPEMSFAPVQNAPKWLVSRFL